jgi:histidinol-phosphatase (PHP family)
MSIISDYHIHTFLCGHAEGEPYAYVDQAIAKGLKEIGFSDHAPLVSHRAPDITMDKDQLPVYHRIIDDLRDRYRWKIKILAGIEADFLVGFEEKTATILKAYPYDYVIGSVHFIKKWGFDDPIQSHIWANRNVDEVYQDYYELLRQSAQSRLFTTMGHVDLVKKFGHKPSNEMIGEVEKTAAVFQKCGTVIEINTSGLRKPVKEIYPSLWSLRIYCRAGVPITFGSDAHRPEEVGADFDAGLALAKKAGYHEYVLFSQGKISEKIKL